MLGATRFPHNCFAHHGQDADTYRPTETQHGLVTDCTRASNGLGAGLSRPSSLRGTHVERARVCSSVVRSAFGRVLCGVRLVLVRVAFVRGGRSRGGSRTHNGLLTDGTRACLRTSDGRATGGHRSDLDESSYSKMGGGVAAAFHAAR